MLDSHASAGATTAEACPLCRGKTYSCIGAVAVRYGWRHASQMASSDTPREVQVDSISTHTVRSIQTATAHEIPQSRTSAHERTLSLPRALPRRWALHNPLVEVSEQGVLWTLRQHLGGHVDRLPVHALRLVSLPVVEHHPHSQTDDEDQSEDLDAGGDYHGDGVFWRELVQEDVGCGSVGELAGSQTKLTADDTAGIGQERKGTDTESSTILGGVVTLVPGVEQDTRCESTACVVS